MEKPNFSHDHVIPKCPCPACGEVQDRAAGGEGDPEAGDATVCIKCGNWNSFGKDLTLTAMTEEQIESLTSEEFNLLSKLSRVIAGVNKADLKKR